MKNKWFKDKLKIKRIWKDFLLWVLFLLSCGLIGTTINLGLQAKHDITTVHLIRFAPTSVQNNSTEVIYNDALNPSINYYNELINSNVYNEGNVLQTANVSFAKISNLFNTYWNNLTTNKQLLFIANAVLNYANFVLNSELANNTNIYAPVNNINNLDCQVSFFLKSVTLQKNSNNNYNIDIKTNETFNYLASNSLILRNVAVANVDFVLSNVSLSQAVQKIGNRYYGGIIAQLPASCLIITSFLPYSNNLVNTNYAKESANVYNLLTSKTIPSANININTTSNLPLYYNNNNSTNLFLMPLRKSLYWIYK